VFVVSSRITRKLGLVVKWSSGVDHLRKLRAEGADLATLLDVDLKQPLEPQIERKGASYGL